MEGIGVWPCRTPGEIIVSIAAKFPAGRHPDPARVLYDALRTDDDTGYGQPLTLRGTLEAASSP